MNSGFDDMSIGLCQDSKQTTMLGILSKVHTGRKMENMSGLML
jgi:hypothetical protein